MPVAKISTKHQVTIPQEVFEQLGLRVGDLVEMLAAQGRIIMTPQQLTARPLAVSLTPAEQDRLPRVKAKIKAIQEDLVHATGLTREEADLAAKVGLIATDQRWWWTEEWQEGEREVERERQDGKTAGPFDTLEGLFAHLDQLRP
jgi:bifunctional DNA-binding transcriptional regulator/antitoxin component of YhaV-PrlF toxin-antitoxin module